MKKSRTLDIPGASDLARPRPNLGSSRLKLRGTEPNSPRQLRRGVSGVDGAWAAVGSSSTTAVWSCSEDRSRPVCKGSDGGTGDAEVSEARRSASV